MCVCVYWLFARVVGVVCVVVVGAGVDYSSWSHGVIGSWFIVVSQREVH